MHKLTNEKSTSLISSQLYDKHQTYLPIGHSVINSRLDSEAAWQVVDRSVIVPHNCYYNQNGWLKYNHRVMYKKYTTPLPSYGMWGSRKTS